MHKKVKVVWRADTLGGGAETLTEDDAFEVYVAALYLPHKYSNLVIEESYRQGYDAPRPYTDCDDQDWRVVRWSKILARRRKNEANARAREKRADAARTRKKKIDALEECGIPIRVVNGRIKNKEMDALLDVLLKLTEK